MERIETHVLVIGGGAVGLAIARAQALAGREVIVLERGAACGAETSTRNNQVVHAGFLYEGGTLKAQLCRVGHGALLDYARARGIAHRTAPKLMLALDEGDLPQLEGMMAQGRAAGLTGLQRLDTAQLAQLEPGIVAAGALLSPDTAIIDAGTLVTALQADLEDAGGLVATRTQATGGALAQAGHVIDAVDADGTAMQITARLVINAAGLGAAPLSQALTGAAPTIHFAKGQFLSHRGATGLHHMVVLLGAALGQGASLTWDTGGQERFGPDISFAAGRDYGLQAPDPQTIAAIRRWYPALDPARLAPEYAGIRPRVTGPGHPPGDWLVTQDHPRLIQLFGIDTPGLTCCLALAAHVAGLSGLETIPQRNAS